MNPDYSDGIYVTASVEDKYIFIDSNKRVK